MSRRRVPRPAAGALQVALRQAAPQTALAATQAAWLGAVGEQLAAVAVPVSERSGVLTIACADSVWAHELDLMGEALLERLRSAMGDRAPEGLRFRVDATHF